MRKISLAAIAVFVSATLFAQTVSGFENLTLAPDTFWDGSDLSGGFASGNAYFENTYDQTYFYWSNGFIYSNMQDSTTVGYTNENAAITASGYNASANYAVAYYDGFDNVTAQLTGNAAGKLADGFYVTNTTYAYLSMRDGDAIGKKFGYDTACNCMDAQDWFKLTVKGWKDGALKTNEVDFYLADFRFADSTQDYIVRDWRWVDLRPLGLVDSLQFSLSSSDNGQYGMNTPAYFAMDNFTTADTSYAAPTASDVNVTLIYPTTDTLIALPITAALSYTVSIISQPVVFGATATIDSATQKLLYTPAVGIVANDTVVYAVTDDAGNADTATVYIAVIDTTDTISTGIHDSYLTQVSVYPNPFSSQVFVSGITHETAIELYNITGALLRKENLNADGTLDFASISTGVYLLKLQSENEVSTIRIVKQ